MFVRVLEDRKRHNGNWRRLLRWMGGMADHLWLAVQ